MSTFLLSHVYTLSIINFIINMQASNKSIKCATDNCANQTQATCLECKLFFCFSCSLKHTQKQPNHSIVQFDSSIKLIHERSQQLIRKLKVYQSEAIAKKQKQEGSKMKGSKSSKSQITYDQRLNPEKFQQQLNYITAIQKQTIKIVQKFFSQLSLEIVSIWQSYLNKFSNPENCLDRIRSVQDKLEKFLNKNKNEDKAQFINNFYNYNAQEEVEECRTMMAEQQKNASQMPICPDIEVGQQMLIMISQLLCNEASTKNYQYPRLKASPEQKIHINTSDTLDSSVKFIPIFPIRKQYCYLYNVNENTYQIQEFDKLDFLPAFPKSILLWNGDIHLVGGANIKQQVINTHVVFRSSTAEVFKLSNMPVCRNPVNGLVATSKIIYMIGGLNQKKQWDSQCFSYNLQKKQWTQLASMKFPKPHQSIALFDNRIFCFGIPAPSKINIEEYDIETNKWKQVTLTNFLCNPFNFASGFSAIQINQTQVLLFGGKKYLENVKNQKRSTDRQITPYMYLFEPNTYSFVQLGSLNPCIGVRDGEINPIIRNGKIYAPEYMISRNKPICRWLSAMHIMEISNTGKVQSVLIMHQD